MSIESLDVSQDVKVRLPLGFGKAKEVCPLVPNLLERAAAHEYAVRKSFGDGPMKMA